MVEHHVVWFEETQDADDAEVVSELEGSVAAPDVVDVAEVFFGADTVVALRPEVRRSADSFQVVRVRISSSCTEIEWSLSARPIDRVCAGTS